MSKYNEYDQSVINYDDYQQKQVAAIIKHYLKICSSLEIAASRLDRVGEISSRTAKEEMLCNIVDIDQGIKQLTPQQQRVILLVKQGYHYHEIGEKLGISIVTVKYHIRQALKRLTTYLNSSRHVQV